MVPKVAKKGTSFKGAGQYYLHDKQADTAERVEFTHTENLPTDNPETAIKCMAHTAMRQNEIKAANGAARTGRKLTYTVYTYSLAWAPDEQPTQEQMIEAGQESLRELGLDRHEVLMVAHNDEPHPHLHLIVNRVHPETGKAAGLSNDHLKLSRWAEAYEKAQGKIRCEERVINNERRRKRKFVKDRRSLDKGSFHNWRRQRSKDAFYVRQMSEKNLDAHHAGQRQALSDRQEARREELYLDKEERISRFVAQLKDQNRAKWAALFREQRAEWRGLNRTQKTVTGRLRHHLKERQNDPRARTKTGRKEMVAEAIRAVLGRDNPHGALSRKHRAERTALADESRREMRQGIEAINERYRQDFVALEQAQEHAQEQVRESQRQERQSLQGEHSRQSQEGARGVKEGRDMAEFRKQAGSAGQEDFKRRVAERIRKRKLRKETWRQRGRGGGRERD
ncbi:MAG: relaxase/mobilization nuclease domain-containing protein [bacterium]